MAFLAETMRIISSESYASYSALSSESREPPVPLRIAPRPKELFSSICPQYDSFPRIYDLRDRLAFIATILASRVFSRSKDGVFTVKWVASKSILALALAFGTAQAAPPSTAAQLAHEALQRRNHSIKIENKFPVVPGCLDKDRQTLHDKIEQGELIPFNELTDALIELHRKHGQKEISSNELNGLLLKFRSGANKSNPSKVKESSEDAIFAHFKEDSAYSAAAASIADICTQNELQCYSGTVLNQVLARKLLGRDDFQKQNSVIIYESGHVLPGYMEREEGDWRLYGIETTSLGPAQINYGLTKNLKRDIRIIDASDWILSEIFEDCMTKPKEFAEEVLARTSKQYHIPLAVTEAAIRSKYPPTPNMAEGALKGANLNASLFGFGDSRAPKGRVARGHLTSAYREQIQDLDAAGGDIHPGRPLPGKDRPGDPQLRIAMQRRAELANKPEQIGPPFVLETLRPLIANPANYDPNLTIEIIPQTYGGSRYSSTPVRFSLLDAVDLESERLFSKHEKIPTDYLKILQSITNHPNFEPNTYEIGQKIIRIFNRSLVGMEDAQAEEISAIVLKTFENLSKNPKLLPSSKRKLARDVGRHLFSSVSTANQVLKQKTAPDQFVEWFLGLNPDSGSIKELRADLVGVASWGAPLVNRTVVLPADSKAIRLLDAYLRSFPE